jgi:plasmid stabilization system protein ParE
MEISFHPLAERELNDAAQYYELERAGLGAAFLSEVERAYNLIIEYPQVGSVVLGPIRRVLVSRFPYALLYATQPDSIRILAVMNLKRRPMYWVGRSD